ncbi:kappa-type opioid receptor-like [Parasteatoda tepidariorum]|uniref:kappa-type opioid receptor-like n=1 Tax=Parasteatoda tepidariorum TaxID=114398 RepID=UPI001C724BFD|nr:kappa-type opioid receptor-like [Parasteatoda tepidariorum]
MGSTNLTNSIDEHSLNFTQAPFAEHHQLPFSSIIGSFFTSIIACTALVGNLAVIITTLWIENLRSQSGNILIVFLACIDVWTAIFVMIPSAIAVATDGWPFGDTLCRINAVFNYLCACASSYITAMISFDRAVAVLFPLRYNSWMTRKAMISICLWIIGNTGSVAIMNGSSSNLSYDYYEAACALPYREYFGRVATYCGCCICYAVPAMVMFTCNVLIFLQIRKSSNKVIGIHISHVGNRSEELTVKKRKDSEMWKSIYSMIAIITVYYICFSPYALAKLVKALLDAYAFPWVDYPITILVFVSSATNPFIYGILRKDYREGFKKIPRLVKEKLYW